MSGRRILYVQFTNPAGYPPLMHSAQILADAGCSVVMLGIEATGHALTAPQHPRLRVRCLRAATGIRLKVTYARFLAWATLWALFWRPHWIYASDSMAAPVARWLRRLGAWQVIFHEHDAPSEAAAGSTPSPFMRRVLRSRAGLVKDADLCVVPSAGRVAILDPRREARQLQVVWNCPRRAEAERTTTRRQSDGELRVLFQGSVVPARLPSTVIDALARVPRARLIIIGYETPGHVGYIASLQARARQLGAAERVEFLGAIPRHLLLERSATCDVGLALFSLESTDLNESSMIGASNKPFEYLACGMPLIVADRPEWQATFVDGGFAIGCDPSDPESVAAAMEWYLERAEVGRVMGEHGRQRVLDDWNYEHCFAPVAGLILNRAAERAEVSTAVTGR